MIKNINRTFYVFYLPERGRSIRLDIFGSIKALPSLINNQNTYYKIFWV